MRKLDLRPVQNQTGHKIRTGNKQRLKNAQRVASITSAPTTRLVTAGGRNPAAQKRGRRRWGCENSPEARRQKPDLPTAVCTTRRSLSGNADFPQHFLRVMVELVIQPATVDQLGVGALLHHATVLEHQNAVGLFHRTQTMRDDE